jgi:hypothetical protein
MKIDKAKQLKLDDFKVKLVKALPEEQLKAIFGGYGASCKDSKDCNSELASGGGTTDTYE